MDPALRERMVRDGAIFDSAGSAPPLSFGDPAREALSALAGCAIYDASPLGRIRMRGKDRQDFLHRLSSQEINALAPGEGAFTVLLNPKGRILDLAHALADRDELVLITSAGNGGKIRAWLDGYLFREEVTLEEAGALPCLGLCGPGSARLLGAAAGGDWGDLPFAHHLPARIGSSQVRVTRSFALAGSSFVVLADEGESLPLYEALRKAGASPAGSEAMERLRVAAGVPAFGRELTEEFNPWEAGLDGAISLTKGCYLGQEVVARLHTYRKVQRRLALLGLEDPSPPPAGAPIFAAGKPVGAITSAALSPDSSGSAALGMIALSSASPGRPVEVESGSGRRSGKILGVPSLPGGASGSVPLTPGKPLP